MARRKSRTEGVIINGSPRTRPEAVSCPEPPERVLLRRYFDEPEDAWEEVSEETVREVFGRYFHDVDQAMEDLRAYPYVTTVSAFYMMGEATDD